MVFWLLVVGYVVATVVVGAIAAACGVDDEDVADIMMFWPLAVLVFVISLPWIVAMTVGRSIRDAIDARKPPANDLAEL